MMDSTELSNVKDEEIDLTDTELDNEDSVSVVSVQTVDNNDATHESDGGDITLKLADSQRNVYYAPDVSSNQSNVLIQEHDESTTDESDPLAPTQPPIIANKVMLKQLADNQQTRRSNAGRKRVFDDEERRQRYNAYHRHLYQKQKLEREKKDKELALLKRKLNLLTSRSSERAPERSLNEQMPKQRVSRFESPFEASLCMQTCVNPTYVWTYTTTKGASRTEELSTMEQMVDVINDLCEELKYDGLLQSSTIQRKM